MQMVTESVRVRAVCPIFTASGWLADNVTVWPYFFFLYHLISKVRFRTRALFVRWRKYLLELNLHTKPYVRAVRDVGHFRCIRAPVPQFIELRGLWRQTNDLPPPVHVFCVDSLLLLSILLLLLALFFAHPPQNKIKMRLASRRPS